MISSTGRCALSLFTLALVAAPLAAERPLPALHAEQLLKGIEDHNRVTVPASVHHAVATAQQIGRTASELPMEKMILSLKMTPQAQQDLQTLLKDQQDPKSPSYHKWLTPEAFGAKFGPSQDRLDAVVAWLQDKGFDVEDLAPGRLSITFNGTRDQVEHAFSTVMMDYMVDGAARHANATPLSIPAALADVVHGLVSLHNIPRQTYNTGFKPMTREDAASVVQKHTPGWKGTANSKAGVYTSPVDWATIYDANTTYTANGTGTGVVIGIVGRTNPGTANWAAFRSAVGLPLNTPTIVVNGTDPGDQGSGEDGEADLDAEWSGGVAPGATVKFVASASTSTTDGVDLSAQYIVNNNLADVMSTSFGSCESAMGSTEMAFYNNLWSQAAAQGITSCVSTGDSGPAGCAGGNDTTGSGQSGVNGLASTPYNIAVGATQFSTSSSYWNASGAAISYIPETPWQESGTVSGGSGLWSTSSGASSTYAKPTWQVAPGVPTASHRYLPDVCLDGSDMFFGNYGMLVYSQGAMSTTGGTSAASPSFAGVMALIVQKYGRQGNANTTLYTLGNAQYANSGTAVFHDINSGNNNVPGLTGFTAGPGWDEVTGLGTPDVSALVTNWNGGSSTTVAVTVNPTSATVATGATQQFTANVTGNSNTAVTWTTTGGTISTAGLYTAPVTVGTYSVKATSVADTTKSASASVTVTSNPTVAVSLTPTTASLTTGGTQQFTASVTGSSNTAVTWSATGGTISTSGLYTAPATAGTYTVKAVSQADTTKSASATVTVTGSVAKQLILNPGFESGSTSWTASSGVIAANGTKEPAHAGTYDAWLCGYGSTHTDSVYQAVAIPSSLTKATLTFWLHIDTADTGTKANDTFKAQVRNSSGTVLATLGTFSNLNAGTGYTQYSYDLSAYKGQTVQIYFTGTENSSLQTSFVLDDINVNVQ